MSQLSFSEVSAAECDIHCAQCDQIIGACPNEWIKLTNTYARSKEKGFHFNTRVSDSGLVVPHSGNANAAEGCLMKEVFCTQCNNPVGQYCSAVPDRERARLKDKHFYKETKIYLKEKSNNARVGLIFVDEVEEDILIPTQRTSMGPPTSLSRIAQSSNGARAPMRQSFPGPESRETRAATYEPQSSSIAGRFTPEFGLGRAASAEPQMAAQAQNIADVSDRVTLTDTRLSNHIIRTNQYEAQLSEHDVELDSHAIEITTLLRKVERIYKDTVVNKMDNRKHQELIDQQAGEIKSLKNQIAALQRNFDQLKDLIADSEGNLKYTQNGFDEHLAKLRRDNRESEALRDENRMLKAKLQSAANVLTFSNGAAEHENDVDDLGAQNDDAQSQGKRRRVHDSTDDGRRKRQLKDKSVAQIFGTDRQFPSPESRRSEEQVKHNAQHAINQHRHSDMFTEWQRTQNALKQREVERDKRERTQQDRFNTNIRQSLPARDSDTASLNSRSAGDTPLDSVLGRTDSPFRSSRPRSIMNRMVPTHSPNVLTAEMHSERPVDPSSARGTAPTPAARPSNIGPLGPRPVVQDEYQDVRTTTARSTSRAAPPALNQPSSSSSLTILPNVQAAIQNLNQAAESHRQSFSPAVGDTSTENIDPEDDELVVGEDRLPSAPESPGAEDPTTSAFSAVGLLNKAASPAKLKANAAGSAPDPIRQSVLYARMHDDAHRPAGLSDVALDAPLISRSKGLATTVARRGPSTNQLSVPSKPLTPAASSTNVTDDIDHVDNCTECGKTGRLLCCDGCSNAYHHRCLNPPRKVKDKIDGDWFCPECVSDARAGAVLEHVQTDVVELTREELAERELLAQALMEDA